MKNGGAAGCGIPLVLREKGDRMDLLTQAREYLSRDPLRYVDMLEPVRRGMVEVTALREDGVLLYNVPGELYMLAADSLDSCQALCAGVDSMELAVAHSQETGEFLRRRYGIKRCRGCTQAAFLGRELPAPSGEVEIRPLGQEFFSVVFENYHSFSDPKYIRERLEAGVMRGAFSQGQLMGFIGMHAEGSVGLLEVLPPYRRRGVATALMTCMAGYCLERGWIPFSQVFDGNTASMELHRQLGWTLCPDKLCWVMN